MISIDKSLELFRNCYEDLSVLNWTEIHFKRESFLVGATIFIVVAFLLKLSSALLRGKEDKSFLVHSGYFFNKKDRPGAIYFVFGNLPTVIAIFACACVLIATGDPFLQHSEYEKIKEVREIIYLRDTSVSMGFKMGDRPRGEILQDFLMELISGRRERGDRSAYIIFASEPRIYSEFTTDTNSLLFSVATGPIVTADESAPKTFPDIFVLKDFEKIPFEGGTDLSLGLDTAMRLFDYKGDKKVSEEIRANPSVKKRSIIILTDGAADRDPEKEFIELKKRNIIPYLIFIDPDREAEKRFHGENSPNAKLPDILFNQVKEAGGQYFLAKDRASMERIKRKLDELQTSLIKAKSYVVEVHIYRTFLVLAIFFSLLAIFLRFVLWTFSRVI